MMIKVVGSAFLVGNLVVIFFVAACLFLFGLPEGAASELFWDIVYMTCPGWRLSPNPLVVAVINGLHYGAVAGVWTWFTRRFLATTE